MRLRLALLGCVVFVGACSVPWVGLWSGEGKADTGLYREYGTRMAHGQVPYRDFYVEFPPGALAALVVPALPGGHYVAWFKGLMLLVGLGCVAVVAVARPRLRAVLPVAVAPALLGPIALNSFDLWPALLTVAALALALSGRETPAGFVLGLSAATKLFGVLALPVLLVHARNRRRVLAAFCVAVLVVWGPFATIGAGGLAYSLRTQAARGLQIESLWASFLTVADRLGVYDARVGIGKPYSIDLQGPPAHALALLSSAIVLAAAFVAWRRYARGEVGRAAAFAASITAFVAFGRVLSPQYLLWLVPLVPLAGGAAVPLLLAALLLTLVWARFPGPFESMAQLGPESWAVLARNLALVALFAVLSRRVRT